MNKLQDLNILPATNINGASVGLKSGSNNGNGLFQSILDTLNGNGHDSNWVSSLYSDTSTKGSFNPGNINAPIGLHGKNRSHNALSKGGHNHEDMIIPASLQIQLVAFLEKQGFSLKDINQALSASKNANGLIRLDSLLAGLSGINSAGNTQNIMLTAKFKEGFSSFLSEQGINPDNFGAFFSSQKNENVVLAGRINSLLTGNQNENSYIDSSQIPGVQEILFNMGLGAGDVKKIIESSKNGKGELLLDKLASELNRFLSTPLSESDLSTILSKNSISVDKRIFDIGNSTPNTDNLSTDKNIHLTDEAQKQVKNDIELLLKEQGISEENIKSILDKINIAFSKMKLEKGAAHGESNPENHKLLTTLTGEKQVISGVFGDSVKQEIAAFLKNKGSSDKDIKSFLDSFSLDIKNAGTGQGDNLLKSSLLNEKVFGLIKNDHFISSADQGNLKLNIAEIINLAEKKAGAAQPDKLFEGLFKTTFKQGSTGKNNSDFLVKETNQVSGLNITQERAIKNIGNVNQAGNAAALPDPLPKIADRIMVMIRTGEYKSRMQITPPDLGKLDIDLTFKNGHIHASLSAENAAVKEIIEANLNQLKQQLTSQGLTVERFDVMVNLDNGKREDNNTWADGKAGKGSGHNTRSKSAAPSEIPVLQPAGAGLINDNRIDVHV